MARVVHFEIHAADPDRVARFYTEVFDWEITKWEGEQEYWLIKTGEAPDMGIDGAIVRRDGENPPADAPTAVVGYVNTIGVDDIDKTIVKAKKAGGMEALPKMEVTGVGWLAYYKDTESNIFGILQPTDESMRP